MHLKGKRPHAELLRGVLDGLGHGDGRKLLHRRGSRRRPSARLRAAQRVPHCPADLPSRLQVGKGEGGRREEEESGERRAGWERGEDR